MDDKFGMAILTNSNISIPQGFGLEDKLCYKCFQSEEQRSYKPDPPPSKVKKKISYIWVYLCIIPFLWLYPYWKIQKLPQGIIINAILPSLFFGLYFFNNYFIGIMLVSASIVYANIIPNVFFIRRWGKRWNHQIESEMTNSESQDSESDTENSKSEK